MTYSTLDNGATTTSPVASTTNNASPPTGMPQSSSPSAPVSSAALTASSPPATGPTPLTTSLLSFTPPPVGVSPMTSARPSTLPLHAPPTSTPIPALSATIAPPVCIGHGLDASATGLIASAVLPSVIGLLLWLLFAILRPRFRQVYALREWFVQPSLRPKALKPSWWAFLFPHVPLVPSVPHDVSDAGKSPAKDAELFPCDEQLSQRSLWIAFLMVLGWAILGLVGVLPLYLVSTPCLARSSPTPFRGMFSTLQDLSLLRLLYLLDAGDVTTAGLKPRSFINGKDAGPNARVRIIILAVFTIVLGVFALLRKILKEFNRLVAYRRRWLETRCEHQDLGWLSIRRAPGFAGWGERRLKDFILKTGLSSSLETNARRNQSRFRRQQTEATELSLNEEAQAEVDIQCLFSIGDTHQLALLIDERDEILENLEVAETKYISSFQLSTPDPSIADLLLPEPPQSNRPYISRPRALGGVRQPPDHPPGSVSTPSHAADSFPKARRARRTANPAHAASSLAPTSFVAPSMYYKLRGVHGVNGGHLSDASRRQTLQESFDSRVVGSRFHEVEREASPYSPQGYGGDYTSTPPGSARPDAVPRYGPNHDGVGGGVDEHGMWQGQDDGTGEGEGEGEGEGKEPLGADEWVEVPRGPAEDVASEDMPARSSPLGGRSSFFSAWLRSRPTDGASSDRERRDTFPRRLDRSSEGGEQSERPSLPPPPHLRVQPQQPFVRPVSGLNHEHLGTVYAEISQWRSKLKMINAEITRVQEECYNEIADGVRLKGWLIVGKGLRFIPGIEIIEGRAKEDIRWDVLQHERTALDTTVLWLIVAVVILLLAAGLTAASGLAAASAPGVAQYLEFFRPLADHDNLGSGLAVGMVPAVAAVVLIAAALAIIDWAARVRGHVSVSVGKLAVLKLTFWVLTGVCVLWLVLAGALIFALQAFETRRGRAKSVADGSIYMSAVALALVLNVAIIFPALLLLQPVRLWRVTWSLRRATTPRQRFRASYPRTYDPSYAIGACILAIIFASTFSLIFPLIGPAVVVLLFLTLVAHRFLVGYVFGRTHSQTGGLAQIWLLRRFATLLSLQPMLLGLILLSRHLWPEGGVLIGSGLFVIVFVEVYTHQKTKLPGRRSLSAITRNSLDAFTEAARTRGAHQADDSASISTLARGQRRRGSMASVLEMMSVTLAVMPSHSPSRGPVPLQTETLDDLIATERAARTHPDAPPHLPPLHFTDHAEEMAGILYAPELIAPPPIIWLPNDTAGVARSEAYDLQKYHGLQVTLDVRTTDDALPRRSASFRRQSGSLRHRRFS